MVSMWKQILLTNTLTSMQINIRRLSLRLALRECYTNVLDSVKMLQIYFLLFTLAGICQALPVFRVAREEGMRIGTYFYHIEDGYYYHLNNERLGTKYFKCIFFERGCRGRAILDSGDGFLSTARHSHDPDPHYADEMALRRIILARCRNLDYASFHQIITEEARRFDQEVRCRVTVARMRTPMRTARLQNYPNIPEDLQSLSTVRMNPQYRTITMTEDGADNLYGGSVTDANGDHNVLFVSQRMLQMLRTLTVVHGDGTFRVVPSGPQAEQVYCIVGVWRHHVIPLAWALMMSLTQVAYTSLLQLLRNLLGPHIELNRVITDFETAQQNAWDSIFNVWVQGCLWHLCRRFLITVGELRLTVRMRRIHEVRRIIRLTMGLPLLPQHLIRQGLILIIQEAMDEGNYIYGLVRPFLQYVWRSWLCWGRRFERISVIGSNQRTNNACESQNRMLRVALGDHPNIYAFIGGIVSIEQRTHEMICALAEGRRVGRGRNRTSVMNDDRVSRLSEDLLQPPGPINQSILRFLRRVSHVMDGMIEEALH